MQTKLKKIIIERYGSINRFSAAAGMHPSTVSLIANGRLVPGAGQRCKIVDALRWEGDPDDLFSADDRQ